MYALLAIYLSVAGPISDPVDYYKTERECNVDRIAAQKAMPNIDFICVVSF